MDTIAHYRILERLGENRIGEIFRARDTQLGRTVALVVPNDEIQTDSARRARLLADAQKAIGVSHPNIAALYESGDEGGRIHLVFEFVPGQTLDRVIAGHPLNARRALDLATQIADALADAHAAELTHGGLTTQSVVVTPKGNAKVLDFGFAQWMSAGSSSNDEAADLDALRVILFEMLTGRVVAETSGPATTVNPSLPPEVDALVSKPVGSAVVLAAELRTMAAVLETRAEAAQKIPRAAVRRPRRSRMPWMAAAMTAAAIAAAAAWWFLRR